MSEHKGDSKGSSSGAKRRRLDDDNAASSLSGLMSTVTAQLDTTLNDAKASKLITEMAAVTVSLVLDYLTWSDVRRVYSSGKLVLSGSGFGPPRPSTFTIDDKAIEQGLLSTEQESGRTDTSAERTIAFLARTVGLSAKTLRIDELRLDFDSWAALLAAFPRLESIILSLPAPRFFAFTQEQARRNVADAAVLSQLFQLLVNQYGHLSSVKLRRSASYVVSEDVLLAWNAAMKNADCPPQWKQIDISDGLLRLGALQSRETAEFLLLLPPGLTSLRLSLNVTERLDLLGKSCPRLVEIDLTSQTRVASGDWVKAFGTERKWRSIKGVRGDFSPQDVASCANAELRHIDFWNNEVIDNKAIKHLLDNSPQLEFFRINQTEHASELARIIAGSACAERLRDFQLDIRGDENDVSEADLATLYLACPKLTSFPSAFDHAANGYSSVMAKALTERKGMLETIVVQQGKNRGWCRAVEAKWTAREVTDILRSSTVWTRVLLHLPGLADGLIDVDWLAAHSHTDAEITIVAPARLSASLLPRLVGGDAENVSLKRITLGSRPSSVLKTPPPPADSAVLLRHLNGPQHRHCALFYATFVSITGQDLLALWSRTVASRPAGLLICVTTEAAAVLVEKHGLRSQYHAVWPFSPTSDLCADETALVATVRVHVVRFLQKGEYIRDRKDGPNFMGEW